MAIISSSQEPIRELRTLLDVKREIKSLDLGIIHTADLTSALHAVAKIKQVDGEARSTDEALACIPLDPNTLLPLLEAPWGARLGYTKDGWKNVRHLVKKALKLSGAYSIVTARRIQRTPEWLRAVDLLPSSIAHTAGIRRASSWGSIHGIGPGQFGNEHLPQVEKWLRQFVPPSRIRDDLVSLVRHWNRAVDAVPAWPGKRLTLAHRREEHYSVRREHWPAELHEEIKLIQATWSNPDPDDLSCPFRPLAKSNIEGGISCLYRALSAYAIATGTSPGDITSPSVLTMPNNAKTALDFMLHWRQKTKPNATISNDAHQAARFILRIARERYRHLIDIEDLLRLQRMVRVRRPKPAGMTKKNREFVNRFDDETLLARFLAVPRLAFERVREKKQLGWLQKNELMVALATVISTYAPLRPRNMCNLIIGKHVFRRRSSGVEILQIKVPGDEVKNYEDLDFELSGEVVEIYDAYVEHQYGSKADEVLYLYRGRRNEKKSPNSLSSQIARFLEREIGLYMTGQLFRHVTGYLYLKDNPGDYETVRQLLGHLDIKTTMTFYAAMDKRFASKRVNAFYEEKRKQLAPRIRRILSRKKAFMASG